METVLTELCELLGTFADMLTGYTATMAEFRDATKPVQGLRPETARPPMKTIATGRNARLLPTVPAAARMRRCTCATGG